MAHPLSDTRPELVCVAVGQALTVGDVELVDDSELTPVEDAGAEIDTETVATDDAVATSLGLDVCESDEVSLPDDDNDDVAHSLGTADGDGVGEREPVAVSQPVAVALVELVSEKEFVGGSLRNAEAENTVDAEMEAVADCDGVADPDAVPHALSLPELVALPLGVADVLAHDVDDALPLSVPLDDGVGVELAENKADAVRAALRVTRGDGVGEPELVATAEAVIDGVTLPLMV